MGEILFCSQPIAALPYYIEGISWNIYSLEELCFYIENNVYLLEKDFMNEELCTWIDKEVKNEKLAERLHDIRKMEGKLSDFVLAILTESGYTPKEQIREVVRLLQQMEEKSDFECGKVRADRLMVKEKYLGSIYEYKSLLESQDAGNQPPELIGNILHNLGTAYARLFLFPEALECYERAYGMNQNPSSLKAALATCECLNDEEHFFELAKANGFDGEDNMRLQKELSAAAGGEKVQKLEAILSELDEKRAEGNKAEYQKGISDILFRWKEEYRRICRI